MIKNITIILVLLYLSLLPLCSLAQENNCELQKWDWAQQITTEGNRFSSQISSIEHDSLNNFYIAGHYDGQITLGDTTLYAGPPNILAHHESDFLAKFDSEGDLIWAQNTGDSDQILLKLFNNELVVLQSGDSVYLSKFSLQGKIHWKKPVGELKDGRTTSLAVDEFGNMYLGGYFINIASFGGEILTSTQPTTGFISKFDEKATLKWSTTVASDVLSYIEGLALNSLGDIYAVGVFQGNIKSGNDSIFAGQSYNSMMLKYSSEGEIISMENVAKAPIESNAQSLTIDRDDNVIVGGFFDSTFTSMDDTAKTIIGTDFYTLNGSFIAKYDVNGFFLWSEKVESDRLVSIHDLEADNENNIYVGANIFTNVLYKYTSSGLQLWSEPITSFMYDGSPFLMDLNSSGEIVTAGRFDQEINFGEIALNPVNEHDYYLAKLSVSSSVQSPDMSPSKVEVDAVTATSATLSWENGDGTGRLVLLKKLGKVNPSNIEDGITYNDGAGEFGLGTQTGEREFVVYVGSGSEVTITGLQKGRPYQVAVIEHHDSSECPDQINYLQEEVAKKIFVTSGGASLFNAYPNPLGQEELTIQLPENISGEDFLTLSNAFGKDVIKRKVKRFTLQENEIKLDLSSVSLSPGIYYLRLTGQPAIRVIKR